MPLLLHKRDSILSNSQNRTVAETGRIYDYTLIDLSSLNNHPREGCRKALTSVTILLTSTNLFLRFHILFIEYNTYSILFFQENIPIFFHLLQVECKLYLIPIELIHISVNIDHRLCQLLTYFWLSHNKGFLGHEFIY